MSYRIRIGPLTSNLRGGPQDARHRAGPLPPQVPGPVLNARTSVRVTPKYTRVRIPTQ